MAAQVKSAQDKLWYRKPASNWNQALPIGNGRLGAMVFGGTDLDVYMLNEDTLWSGYPADTNNYGSASHFKQAAALAMDKKYIEAQDLIEEHMLGKWGQCYLPAGDLVIESNISAGDAYTRMLDIADAMHTIRFVSGGVAYTREAFVSVADDIFCISCRADRPGSISMAVSLRSPLQTGYEAQNNRLTLQGQAPGDCVPSYIEAENHLWYSDIDCQKGMTYCIMADVLPSGGSLCCAQGKITISGADAVEIRLAIHTSFNGFDKHPYLQDRDARKLCRNQLAMAGAFEYQTLKGRHISQYRRYYDRIELDLGEGREDLPTDERLRQFGVTQDDNSLAALLFQYGRYLLISSSQPGTQPANLQGIWNHMLCPPWSSNYTVNINTQMNYWHALACNLQECCEPLHRMLKELAVTGAVTARAHYGADGFCAHHNVDLWRLSAPVGNWGKGAAVYAFFPLGGAWLTRALWEQYEYTLDRDFLKDTAYEIIKESVRFCDSMLSQDAQGILYFSPGTSPENTFCLDGRTCCVAATSTMAMSIVRDLFGIFIKAARVLGCDEEYAATIGVRLGKLYGYQIGSEGQLLEWSEELQETDPHHRHISHLYALHPADIINAEDTPELLDACRQSLNLRGDDGTGWSLAWKINCWARLRDGDHALKLVNTQLRLADDADTATRMQGGGTYPNLLDAHPPFQIDGNFGVSSGIAQMLLQSREGVAILLPALPAKWPSGCVKGLCARGGIVADIAWQNGKLDTFRLRSTHTLKISLIYGRQSEQVELKAGEDACFGSALQRI